MDEGVKAHLIVKLVLAGKYKLNDKGRCGFREGCFSIWLRNAGLSFPIPLSLQSSFQNNTLKKLYNKKAIETAYRSLEAVQITRTRSKVHAANEQWYRVMQHK